ncbi:Phospholysine phosphohistidine inorganic pyrophosphate phosphatase [Galemys pyrenaicus]|uniref:Phospholysine phosphohistidine inorganic pyrophosphate phosphatase n=1 Tax=Galemys pyrenaicus TaxID=202257 RepID=A0A8J6A996_GALPY|nr:Phospholysine phosphohistidine inorganic pyrophosphate phosphatase [Galemys pyrenaicus]
MIGDDIVGDVGGAQRCGMRALQVRTGKFRWGEKVGCSGVFQAEASSAGRTGGASSALAALRICVSGTVITALVEAGGRKLTRAAGGTLGTWTASCWIAGLVGSAVPMWPEIHTGPRVPA